MQLELNYRQKMGVRLAVMEIQAAVARISAAQIHLDDVMESLTTGSPHTKARDMTSDRKIGAHNWGLFAIRKDAEKAMRNLKERIGDE